MKGTLKENERKITGNECKMKGMHANERKMKENACK